MSGASVNISTTSAAATLAGTFVSLILYGISVMQTFVYFVRYQSDKLYLKLLVTVVFLLDTANKMILCVLVWDYFIANFGNYANLYHIHKWSYGLTLTTLAIVSLIQLFFMYRIWYLSSGYFKNIFVAVMIPFILAQPLLAIYYVVKVLPISDIQMLSASPAPVVISSEISIATAVIDVVIMLVMCVLLAREKNGFNAGTDRILTRLIVVSVNTGSWTAVVSIVTAIMLLTYQLQGVYVGVFYPLSTLFSNMLLANLNLRSFVRNAGKQGIYKVSSLHIARQTTTTTIDVASEAQKSILNAAQAKMALDV